MHHQFAGDACAGRSSFSQIVTDATILALLVPAKAAVGHGLGSKILQTTKERIVFWNFEISAQNGDPDQPGKRKEKSSGRGHGICDCRRRSELTEQTKVTAPVGGDVAWLQKAIPQLETIFRVCGGKFFV